MTDIIENGMELHSDPLADHILEIVNGATKYRVMVQCIEAGFFDDIESMGESVSMETLSKKFGYKIDILERLLNTLTSYKLIQNEKNKKGTTVYRNAPSTSKYLTRSKKPTMLGLIMMNDKMCSPLIESLPDLLKNGIPKFDINKNVPDVKNETKKQDPNHTDLKNEINMQDTKMLRDPKQISTNNSPMKQQKNGKMSPMPNGKMPPGGMPPMMTPAAMLQKMTSMDNPPLEMLTKFIMATDAFSCSCAGAVVRAFDLSTHRDAVDLGGGSGRISFELSRTYSNMNVTMFDLPPVIQIAQKCFSNNSDSRVKYTAGDFFEGDLPSGDLYILGHILHSWDDQNIDKLLTKIYAKLPPGGSLLTLEKVLDDDKCGPEICATNDLVLSLMSKGRERNAAEYQKLFAKHGFTNLQVKLIDGFNYCDAILVKKPF